VQQVCGTEPWSAYVCLRPNSTELRTGASRPHHHDWTMLCSNISSVSLSASLPMLQRTSNSPASFCAPLLTSHRFQTTTITLPTWRSLHATEHTLHGAVSTTKRSDEMVVLHLKWRVRLRTHSLVGRRVSLDLMVELRRVGGGKGKFMFER
jgi:hypothetical protein